MADIEPPSFSLGLDLDFEPEPQHHPPTTQQRFEVDDDEEGLQLWVSDSDLDDPSPTLRRLRRGVPSSSKPIPAPNHLPTPNDDEDDIQNFSSQELPPTTADLPAPQQHSLCSSSKLPLFGCGILASQHETKAVNGKRKQDSSCPSTSLDACKGKSLLKDLNASPLRRFRLIDSDSDSDDPSESVHIGRDNNVLDFSKKNGQNQLTQGCHQSACKEKISSSAPCLEKQDLWKGFHANHSRATPTPAFDDFCKEYFSTPKDRKQPSGSVHELCSYGLENNNTRKMIPSQISESNHPPSHHYFFHNDLRIQSLVRSRLPYFQPLGTSGEEVNKSFNASPIDYMSQFGHGDAAKQPSARQANAGKSSGRTGKKTRKSNLKETAHASDGWVNPKQAVSCPTDAGRRRVCADGQSSGQWFTGENGKKVYVSKTGKELTGRLAYKSYKQENGRGFKRSKKKAASKKKK